MCKDNHPPKKSQVVRVTANMTMLAQKSKYSDVVESYMQNRPPHQTSHPSFQCLGEEAAQDLEQALPAYSQIWSDPPKIEIEKAEDSESSDDGEVDSSMYQL